LEIGAVVAAANRLPANARVNIKTAGPVALNGLLQHQLNAVVDLVAILVAAARANLKLAFDLVKTGLPVAGFAGIGKRVDR
jgi:hypothetical protein